MLSRNTTLGFSKPSGIRRFSALAVTTPGCIFNYWRWEKTLRSYLQLADRELGSWKHALSTQRWYS